MKLAERMTAFSALALPPTEQLLILGGDARIALDPSSGLNQYGCQPLPDPSLLDFASSTASVISRAAFTATKQLRERLQQEIRHDTLENVCANEMQRIRQELLCDVSDLGVELVFAASGTDAHFMVARYVARTDDRALSVVMVEESETGSGVAEALTGRHSTEKRCGTGGAIEVLSVALRQDDGAPRPYVEVDADVIAMVNGAVARGRRVLLVMVDQSKTGLIAPSPDCAAGLHREHAGLIEVLVDACQFRIAPPTLRAYLKLGFMVALTGSKFFTGPSFSAALLLPKSVEERPRLRSFPRPETVADSGDTGQRDDLAGLGLLLRWEAALTELRRFRAVPQADIIGYLAAFAQAVQHRLMNDPHFELLPVPQLERGLALARPSWDQLPTVFPFLLYHPQSRVPLSREETLQIYRQLPVTLKADPDNGIAALRCQLGQAVACGTQNGVNVSALRLCISARQISDAAAHQGISAVISEAWAVLDKTSYLIDLI